MICVYTDILVFYITLLTFLYVIFICGRSKVNLKFITFTDSIPIKNMYTQKDICNFWVSFFLENLKR